MTVCNLNQIEASWLKEKKLYNNAKGTNNFKVKWLGSEGHADFLGAASVTIKTRQRCRNLFTSMSFQEKSLTWKNLPEKAMQHNLVGPSYYPTDFGACCLFVPHVDFDGFDSTMNLTYGEYYHTLQANASNGESNGLTLLLDTEQFNYAEHNRVPGGLKLSLHHHSDKPMIQFSSQLISTGLETHINLKPTLSYTTENAISMLSPLDRDCYSDGEANLTYLPYSSGYRYEMNNCLIDRMIGDIIWQCGCKPSFYEIGWQNLSMEEINYIACQGNRLECAIARMKSMNSDNLTEAFSIDMTEPLRILEKLGAVPKPSVSIDCLPACEVQENSNQMSLALYPQKDNFFHQQRFCHVASHIWQITCQDKNRKYFLDLQQPELCQTLEYFGDYFNENSSCQNWPKNFLEEFKKPNETLLGEMVEYGRKNLAAVKVMIQSPYVTRIKRDVAMTFTNYVANSGGLLGLCLGFSFISGVELIFWFCCCCGVFKEKVSCSCNVPITTKRIKKKTTATGNTF